MKKRYLAVCAAFALAASGASATIINWSATIDGLQEVPSNASPATGSATGAYDDVTMLLTWTGTFSGLTANSSDAHFHGPAAPGVSAGVQVPMTVLPDIFPLGVTAGAFSGTAILTAAQETMFLDEELYINIHSVGPFAGGEIRGQVLLTPVPEPATLGLLALGFAGLAWTGRRRV